MSVIVTGVQGVPLAPRQEIRTMMQDVPLFTLYLLAVKEMQAVPEKEPLSWFQIAGIHGFPTTIYDPPNGGEKNAYGYCQHSTPLFPGWHRPYLALFEQTLATHVKAIANKYPLATRDKYVRAAEKFRIPYWDWAYYADPPDVLSREEEFVLDTPEGPKPVKNPLLSYEFKDKNFSPWTRTIRWPNSRNREASSQAVLMDHVLDNQKLHTRDLTVNLLASTSYQQFSHDGLPNATDNRRYLSLESLHGLYHGLVGGNIGVLSGFNRDAEKPEDWQGHTIGNGGQMGDIGYAAFDPMFMMHHANVDRLFALWQALNPGTYERYFAEYTGPTDLAPFRQSLKPKTTYWTAAGIRDTRTSFNYTYPELVEWSSLGKEAKQDRLMKIITDLYRRKSPVGVLEPGLFSAVKAPIRKIDPEAPSTFASRLAAAKEAPAASTTDSPSIEVPVASAMKVSSTDAPQVSTTAALTTPRQYNDWNVNITVEKHSVKTSFFVHVFLGDFDPNPSKWLTEKTLVGSYYVFTSDIETTGCGRCKENAANNLKVAGSVPLTGALLDSPLAERLGKDKVALLGPEEMIPYLKKELHWRVQTQGGDVVELKDMPSLKISVVHYPATTPTNPLSFATKGEGIIHTAATSGRPGGFGEDDLTIKPSTTYAPEGTTDQAYDTKKASNPTYGTTDPGATYDAKSSSDPSYGAKPPPGSTYTPTPTYGSKPPTNYDPKPTHGPGYVHKDCSCGAEIASDCSCKATRKTVVIDGRIREDVRRCSYEFDLPCNHIAVMYGVRTAIHEQIVNITIRRKSERKAYKDWSFEGKNDAGLLNLEGSRDAYNLNITPEAVDRVVVITFQSYADGEYKSSDMRYKEVVISTDTSSYCSYFYTFFVEAGDDCDYHDTDFCVSVLPSKK